jgi:hypothetical protein
MDLERGISVLLPAMNQVQSGFQAEVWRDRVAPVNLIRCGKSPRDARNPFPGRPFPATFCSVVAVVAVAFS